MPEIYAYGDPNGEIIACALCHYPNDKGKAENAPPAGQNKDYLIQQLLDFKNGLRKSAEPRKKLPAYDRLRCLDDRIGNRIRFRVNGFDEMDTTDSACRNRHRA